MGSIQAAVSYGGSITMWRRAVSTKWEALGQAGAKSQAGSGGDQRGARRCSGGLEGLQEGPQSQLDQNHGNQNLNSGILIVSTKVPGQKGNKVPKGALGGRKGCKRGPSPMFTNSRIKEIQQKGVS